MARDPTTPAGASSGRAWRIPLQILVGLLAVAAFLWLYNIVSAYGANPFWADLVGKLSKDAWIVITLGVLAVLLVVQILLMLGSGARRAARRAARASEESMESQPPADWVATDPHSMFRIGCKGCGTVFEVEESKVGPSPFACPNCGRMGQIRSNVATNKPIRNVTCASCSTKYAAHSAAASCPKCGASN